MKRLVCMAAAAFGLVLSSAVTTASAAPVHVNYFFVENFNGPAYDRGGVTVTGSANVTLGQFTALGIAGGLNNRVDGLNGNAEWVEFTFNAGPAVDVSWAIADSGDGNDPNTTLGDATVQAWDANGVSLGTRSTSASVGFARDLQTLYGPGEFSRFRLTSVLGNDSFNVWSVTYTPVPEPTTLAVGAVIGTGLLLRRRRRRE